MNLTTEHDEQAAFFDWWENAARIHRIDPLLCFAIPNAGKRSYGAAARMRAEGLKKGVLDVFLAFPAAGYAGLFMEFKLPKKKLTPEQAHFGPLVWRMGYGSAVVRSCDEAITCVTLYLSGQIGQFSGRLDPNNSRKA